ncbi:MAG: biopolymer transporter ExbD [Azoarcus sp.]|jgi:biopolymer transport protein ExbD|nr:biopolymer transporter ExbD [Azoarcus sp.]
MDFRHTSGQKDEPEINLVPLIDVMLVIIIFLMLTTTFNKTAGLAIALPTADASGAAAAVSEEIIVAVTASGDILVNGRSVPDKSVDAIASALASARPAKGAEPVVVINADAQAAHQNVINVMQAAQHAGLSHVTFATQQEPRR